MNTKTILDFLIKASKDLDQPFYFKEMIDKLTNEVKLDSMPKTTTKARSNKVLSYAKKVAKLRPVLAKTTTLEDKQFFTDAYFAVAVVEEDALPLEYVTEKDNYPKVDKLFTFKELKMTFNTVDILNAFKTNDVVKLVKECYELIIEKNNFEHFLTFMNYQENTITFEFNTNDYTYVVNKPNGTKGLILGVRPYEEQELYELRSIE